MATMLETVNLHQKRRQEHFVKKINFSKFKFLNFTYGKFLIMVYLYEI